MHPAPFLLLPSSALALILGAGGLPPAPKVQGNPSRAGGISGTTAMTYDQIIEKGYAALGKGQLAQADALAQQALQTPARHEGHLLAGMVAFRNGDLDRAEAALAKAMSLAPPEAKAKVDKARSVLRARRDFEQHRKAAEEAEAGGLTSKAAREYTSAWESDPGDEATGLKAARLWAERTGTPENALPILARILENPRDFAVADAARKLMDPLAAKLAPLAEEELRKGTEEMVSAMYIRWANDGGVPRFRRAAAMMPTHPLPHLRLAEVAAYLHYDAKYSRKPEAPGIVEQQRLEVIANLRAAFRRAGAVQPQEFIRLLSLRPQLLRTLRDPVFRELYVDAFGPDIATQAAEMQRARFDAALGRTQGTVAAFDGINSQYENSRSGSEVSLDLRGATFGFQQRDFMQDRDLYGGGGWKARVYDRSFVAELEFANLRDITLWTWKTESSPSTRLFMSLDVTGSLKMYRSRSYDKPWSDEKQQGDGCVTVELDAWPTRLLDAFRAAGIDVVDKTS